MPRDDDPIPVRIFNRAEATSTDLKSESATFRWFQLFIEILFKLQDQATEKIEFLRICRKKYAENAFELSMVQQFDETYVATEALSWYTRNCFLYRMLNKALREQDIDVLLALRFFINDLYLQLQANQLQDPNLNLLYRGQILSKHVSRFLCNFVVP